MSEPRSREGKRRGHKLTAEKIVRLLELVVGTNGESGVRAIARLAGMDKSTVNRLLIQLQDLRIVESGVIAGRYIIGPRLFSLAAAVSARDDLWMAAKPTLERLAARFNETCYVAVLETGAYVFKNKVECTQPIRFVFELGQRLPLHAGAGGRAILMGMRREQMEEIIQRTTLEPLTTNTITDSESLRGQILRDRRRRYCVSIGERVVGGSAIASPFFGADGSCLGSVVFTCPAIRLDKSKIPEIGRAVLTASMQLSTRLGRPANQANYGSLAPVSRPRLD